MRICVFEVPMLLVTGRNEVVAKVMFLQVSVIHSVHRGRGVGSPENPPNQGDPPGQGEPPRPRRTPPQDQGEPPQTRQTPPGTRENPRIRQTPPRDQGQPRPGKKTAAYGQWAAGTHPTGMHSCILE